MKSPNISYLPAVDQLRGAAALLILLYHGTQLYFRAMTGSDAWRTARNPFDALVIEGHTSVALFMVLSGFIFSYGTWGHGVQVGTFLRNRFLRTYPLMLFFLALGLCSHAANVTLPETLMTAFGMANFPHAQVLPPFSGMFWAVAVEWQFYLLFPFLLRAYESHGDRFIFGLLSLLLLARLIAVKSGTDPLFLTYWTLAGRLDQFLIGMAFGRVVHVRLPGRAWRGVFPAAFVGVLALVSVQNWLGGWPDARLYRIAWTTVEGGVWGLFLVGYVAVAGRLPRLLTAPLERLGTLSYSVYLWHFPLLETLCRVKLWITLASPVAASYVSTVVVLLPLTVAVSVVSYFTIEKPFLGMRRRYVDRSPSVARSPLASPVPPAGDEMNERATTSCP